MATRTDTLFDHLEREWNQLLTRGELDAALERWRERDDRLQPFTSIEALLALLTDREAEPQWQSDALLALLSAARTDRLAARLVLQRFIPPLKLIACWRQPFPKADWIAQIVSATFEVIVTYPVEHRRVRVAANIVWDVRKRMDAALAEHRRWQAELLVDEREVLEAAPDPADSVIASQLLRWAGRRSHVAPDVADVIVLTRLAGYSLEEAATIAGVPSARLRQRRWRGEQRIRALLAPACADGCS